MFNNANNPNSVPSFPDSAPEAALAAREHEQRMRISALGAARALLEQYGSAVAIVYETNIRSLQADGAPADGFGDAEYQEELAA